MERVKILYLVPAIPHYFRDLINYIIEDSEFDIICVKPKKKGKGVGESVFEDSSNRIFRIEELDEKKSILGKPYFAGLDKLILSEKPKIIISGWPLIMGFIHSNKLKNLLKKLDIKLICREIPFNVPPFGDEKSFLKEGLLFNEKEHSSTPLSFSNLVKQKVLSRFRRKYYQLADHLIFYIKDGVALMESYGVPSDRITVAPNTPDTNKLLEASAKAAALPPPFPPNTHRLIHVGRLVKWKRVDLIIQTLDNLKHSFPEMALTVIGNGPEEENLKQLTTDLGLEDRVQFVGGVYDPIELGSYFLNARVFVIAGMGGLSINDAMCFGKPVICSIADGTEKLLVRDGFNGYFFKNGDVHDLIKKIELIFSTPGCVEKLGQNSLDIIKQEVNIANTSSIYVQVFRTLLKN